MYCKYQMLQTATLSDVANDLLAIFTGEILVNNLSNSCNKLSTYIKGINAGWVLHDKVSATKFVIKAKEANNILDKFVLIEVTATTILFDVYETWNATTHTGTNAVGNVRSITFLPSPNTTLFLFAKREYLILHGQTDGIWNTYTPASLEITRDDPWNTPALGYSAHVLCCEVQAMDYSYNTSRFTSFHLPRMKGETTDLTAANAHLQFKSPFGNSLNPGAAGGGTFGFTLNSIGMPRGINFNDILVPVMDITLHRYVSDTYHFLGGTVLGGLKVMPSFFGNDSDEFLYNSQLYFIITSLSRNTRKSTSLLIPLE